MDNPDLIEKWEVEFQDFVSGMYKELGYDSTIFILDETLATLKLQSYSMKWLKECRSDNKSHTPNP